MTYPKLRYPIHTKGLSNEDRCILLAYDCIYRMKNEVNNIPDKGIKVGAFDFSNDLAEDSDANLANLGHHIETNICGGDMALRFEGYDNMSSGDMVKHFQDKVDRELEENESKN